MDAGHDAHAVDDALRKADEPALIDVRGRAIIVAVVAFIAAALVIVFAFSDSENEYVPDDLPTLLWSATLYLLPGLIVSLIGIVIVNRRRVPPNRVVSSLAVGLTIPFVVVIAMTGFCLTGR